MAGVLQMAIRKVGGFGRDEGAEVDPVEAAADERRREFTKRVQDTSQAVQTASTRLQLAIAEFGASLDALSVAFEELDRVTHISAYEKTDAEIALETEGACTTLHSACAALKLQLAELRSTDQDNIGKYLQGELHEPVQRLLQVHHEVDALRHVHHRSARILEAARAEVLSKEKEYQSKGRSIAESKLYPQLVQNLTDAKASFTSASSAFHETCDALMSDSQVVSAQCFQASMYRIGTWAEAVAERLGGVVSLCNR